MFITDKDCELIYTYCNLPVVILPVNKCPPLSSVPFQTPVDCIDSKTQLTPVRSTEPLSHFQETLVSSPADAMRKPSQSTYTQPHPQGSSVFGRSHCTLGRQVQLIPLHHDL